MPPAALPPDTALPGAASRRPVPLMLLSVVGLAGHLQGQAGAGAGGWGAMHGFMRLIMDEPAGRPRPTIISHSHDTKLGRLPLRMHALLRGPTQSATRSHLSASSRHVQACMNIPSMRSYCSNRAAAPCSQGATGLRGKCLLTAAAHCNRTGAPVSQPQSAFQSLYCTPIAVGTQFAPPRITICAVAPTQSRGTAHVVCRVLQRVTASVGPPLAHQAVQQRAVPRANAEHAVLA